MSHGCTSVANNTNFHQILQNTLVPIFVFENALNLPENGIMYRR